MAIRTVWEFAKLFWSKPAVTLRLLNPRRIILGLKVLVLHPRNLGQMYRRYSAIYLSGSQQQIDALPAGDRQHPDIVFFPVIDWHFRFQRPQQLATELGKAGHRVFYLATTPLIAARDKPFVIQESPCPNVFVVQLKSGASRLPDFYLDSFSEQEVAGISASLQVLMQQLDNGSAIAIAQHPIWSPVLDATRWKSVVYDCLDHHAGFLDDVPATLLQLEQRMVQRADVITVSSEKLREDIAAHRPATVIRNGCDFAKFSAAVRKKQPRTTIGYVGAIASWFDVEVVAALARAHPDWDVVLVGSSVGADVGALKHAPNIQLIGEVEYGDVPGWMASFDVCLIPFRRIPLTEATNPVKVYEYLATGRPVVATDLPELQGLSSHDVFLAVTPAQFVAQIELALQCADDPARIAQRQRWAASNDWSARAAQLLALI